MQSILLVKHNLSKQRREGLMCKTNAIVLFWVRKNKKQNRCLEVTLLFKSPNPLSLVTPRHLILVYPVICSLSILSILIAHPLLPVSWSVLMSPSIKHLLPLCLHALYIYFLKAFYCSDQLSPSMNYTHSTSIHSPQI